MDNMNYNVLKKYILEKEKKLISNEDKEKMDTIKELVEDEYSFFELGYDASIGILEFLEVPEGEVMDIYFSLVSPEKYKKSGINQYRLIDENDTIRR